MAPCWTLLTKVARGARCERPAPVDALLGRVVSLRIKEPLELRPVDGLCDLEKNSDMNDMAMLALLSGPWCSGCMENQWSRDLRNFGSRLNYEFWI